MPTPMYLEKLWAVGVGDAMDIALGGQFTSIPASYPTGAWYTYDDDSCDYACQITEYVFWALTSILGAHENRLGEIDNEWKLNTPAKVQQTDTAIYAPHRPSIPFPHRSARWRLQWSIGRLK